MTASIRLTNEEALELVHAARAGDEGAANRLVQSLQHRVYGLALRMLASPPDAEDATQEILLRVLTNLATFRGDAAFSTWVHRIAVNHLVNARNRSGPERTFSFDEFGAQIDAGVARFSDEETATDRMLRNEVRLSCTHAMIVCLSREERIAFLLGAIFELTAPEASAILEITPAAFRKRLSRARSRLEDFMRVRCGLYDANTACRCDKQALLAMRDGRLDPSKPVYARLPVLEPALSGAADIGTTGTQAAIAATHMAGDEARELTNLLDVVAVLCTQPTYAAPEGTVQRITRILRGRRDDVPPHHQA